MGKIIADSNVGQKIWSMANALRDDGIGKSDYLEQLTYLLFIKMVDEYSKPPYNRKIGIPMIVIGVVCVQKAAESYSRIMNM